MKVRRHSKNIPPSQLEQRIAHLPYPQQGVGSVPSLQINLPVLISECPRQVWAVARERALAIAMMVGSEKCILAGKDCWMNSYGLRM